MPKIRHFLLCFIYVLVVITIVSSYYRFVVNRDFLVTYEVACDPLTTSCFRGCGDETCVDTYPYALVERPAYLLTNICPNAQADCLISSTCQPQEQSCHTIFCDSVLGNDCFDSEI